MSPLLARLLSTGRCYALHWGRKVSTYPVGTLHAATLTFQARCVHRYSRDMTCTESECRPAPQNIHTWCCKPGRKAHIWGRGSSYLCFAKWTCLSDCLQNIYAYSQRLVLFSTLVREASCSEQ